MVLAQDTDDIFLDEPTSYLDINHQIEFIELLKRLQIEMGKTIITVLYDISLIAKYSDFVVTLKDGQLHSTWLSRADEGLSSSTNTTKI